MFSVERELYDEQMEWQILAKRFFEHEVTFTFRYKTPDGRYKRIEDALRLGVLHVEYERLKKKQMQQDK